MLGRLPEARAQFTLALDMKPDYLSARFNLALAFQETHDWAQAIENYHK